MSDTFNQILRLVELGDVKISDHGYDELAADGISARDGVISIRTGANPIHVLWGIPKGSSSPAVLITAYRPDPMRWEPDFLRRKDKRQAPHEDGSRGRARGRGRSRVGLHRRRVVSVPVIGGRVQARRCPRSSAGGRHQVGSETREGLHVDACVTLMARPTYPLQSTGEPVSLTTPNARAVVLSEKPAGGGT